MAKNMEDEMFKTAKFGGYDKASVDYYIEDLKKQHEREVDELKSNVNKLSEAVLSLKTMREVNMNESNKTIEDLKNSNAAFESEIESLKEQINAYKQREFESAGRYESISRTLLEARESADLLISQTNQKCEAQEAEVTAKCETMVRETTERCNTFERETTERCNALERETAERCNTLERETTERCNALDSETRQKCQAMYEQTETTCANLKEEAYSESERTRNNAHEAAEALKAQTEYECRTQKEEARNEAESIVNQATSEAYMLRKNVKRECESVSKYMSDLLSSLDGVVNACSVTKEVADKAFTGLKSEATDAVTEDTEGNTESAEEAEGVEEQ